VKKALHVIRREYLESARKKSFIISTILAPILILVVYAIPILTIFFIPPEEVSVAVFDRTGTVAHEFVSLFPSTPVAGGANYRFVIPDFRDRDPDEYLSILIASVDNNAIDVLIEIPEDVLETGRVNYISKDYFNERVMEEMRENLNSIVIAKRLANEGIDYDKVVALTDRIQFNEMKLNRSGVPEDMELVGEFFLVVVFVMILYMTLLSWGIAVQRSIIADKSSRVVEVMLSSVEPKDLFIGKIIGVGSLGLTQIGIWSLIMLGLGVSSSMVFPQLSEYVRIAPGDVIYFVVFFVLGFLLYSSIFTVIGSMCSTEQDAQQLQSIVVFPMLIPIMLVFVVIQNPSSVIATVLSLIPFFSPMLLLARVVISEPPWWEVALGFALLLVTIYGVIIFSSRVFRTGILMYGKRPGLREIIRWFRYA
jgi:ABC-2 type transport system permease protein